MKKLEIRNVLAGSLAILAGVALIIGFRHGFQVSAGMFAVALLVLYSLSFINRDKEHVYQNEFGTLKVVESRAAGLVTLSNSGTVHGLQSLDPQLKKEPSSYLHKTGPVGDVFRILEAEIANRPIAAIGLGTGTVAAYGKKGQELCFYEKNPLVGKVAAERFTYVSDSEADVRIVYGDAFIELNSAPMAHYGLIMVDAYDGGEIPEELLGEQALLLYISRLAPGGVILINISHTARNYEVELEPRIRKLELVAALREDPETGFLKLDSKWLLACARRYPVNKLCIAAGWRQV